MTDNRINDVLNVRRRIHAICRDSFGNETEDTARMVATLISNRHGIRAAREELQALVRDCIADTDSASLKSLIAPGMAIRSLLNAAVTLDMETQIANLNQCARWLEQDIQQHGGIDL